MDHKKEDRISMQVALLVFFILLAACVFSYEKQVATRPENKAAENLVVALIPDNPATPAVKPCVALKCKVLAFTATWCGPCRAAQPRIIEAQKKGLDVVFIDIDEHPDLARRYGVRSVPDFLIYMDGVNFTKRTHDAGEVLQLVN